MEFSSNGLIIVMMFIISSWSGQSVPSTSGFMLNCSREIELAISSAKDSPNNINRESVLHHCLENNRFDITQLPKKGANIFRIGYNFDFVNLISLENDGTIVIIADLEFTWTDEFRKWNASEVLGLGKISIPSLEIWTPKFLLTTCESESCLFGANDEMYAVAFATGYSAIFLQNRKMTASCNMDLTEFPYDSQACSLTFQVQSNLKSRVSIISTNGTFLKDMVDNDEWDLPEITDNPINVTYWRYYRNEKDRYNLKHREEQSIQMEGFIVELFLKRRPFYYTANSIVPVFLISIIGVFANFLRATSSDKVNVQVTTLLGFLFLQSLTATIIPQSATTPNITLYILYALLISVFNVLYSSALLMGRTKKGVKLPKCLEKIFVQYLGFVLRPSKLFALLKPGKKSISHTDSVNNGRLCSSSNFQEDRIAATNEIYHERPIYFQSFLDLNSPQPIETSFDNKGNLKDDKSKEEKHPDLNDKAAKRKRRLWNEFLGNLNLILALVSFTLSAINFWFYLLPLIFIYRFDK